MASKVGIAGEPNSGKSYSRRTIPDGENIIILAPSNKATHLTTSDNQPLRPLNVKTNNFQNIDEAMQKLKVSQKHLLVKYWNDKLSPGKFKPENLTGNIQMVEDVSHLPIWMEFISKHLTWVHTVIIPDFTHFISREVSEEAFINRRAQGEAYQKFWELAAKTLRNFIISIDKYREDLIVVTEYHAEYNSDTDNYEIFVPAGKMLTEKFKVPSYYDILLFTDIKVADDDTDDPEYRFVTKPTKKYKYARAMNLFEETFIPNDLQLILVKVREYLGISIEQKQKKEKATKTKS